MAEKTPIQTIVNTSADPQLQKLYTDNAQSVPIVSGNTTVVITNVNEYTTINVSSPAEPAGNTGELQFNNDGRMDGDDGLTYNPTTDSLTVIGNLTAGTVLTNNLKYANGTSWPISGSTYGNSNVSVYLPTYTGNLGAVNTITANLFNGNGAGLTNVNAANVIGTVSSASSATSATTATTAGSATTAVNVTSGAQPNITSTGTLSSLNVTATVTAGNLSSTGRIVSTGNLTSGNANLGNLVTASFFSGDGHLLSNISGANINGTVASATSAGSATTAGTVTANAQPNITSVGTLNGIVATDTINLTGASNVALGVVGNVKITGGSNGQVLTATAVNGVLQWSTPTVGTLQDVTTNGNTTNQVISISNTTVSTSYTTGALKVSGGVGIGGNTHLNGHLAAAQQVYAGHLSDFGSWLNPLFVGRSAGANYVQSAMINTNTEGSSDWIAYGDASDTNTGWADLGFTGTGFNDPLYTITKPSDGYVFVQGLGVTNGGPQGGNLVLATGGDGANNDIVFALGSFYANAEYARMDDDSNTFYIGGHAYGPTGENPTPRVVNLNVNGNVTTGGNLTFSNSAHTIINYGANNYINMNNDGGIDLSCNTEIKITTNYGDAPNRKYSYFYANGSMGVSGHILPTANVSYDLGSDTARFRDLYLSGTTINLGGTLIQAQANGQVSIGNATFSSSGTISAADVTLGITTLTSNSVASSSHVGTMAVYSPVSPDGITYDIPNVATAGFAIGSRIELFVDSASFIMISPTPGSGVSIKLSKGLDATGGPNSWSISNTQAAKLTMFASDKWILSA